ncbi:hypothetical protein [Kineococcus endophyticus]
MALTSDAPHRRSHWRGERKAVLIRMPLADAEQLRIAAEGQGLSVSELAATLIAAGLSKTTRTAA